MSGMSAADILLGIKEAIFDPIKKDFERAYVFQRAARERNPIADSALNFVPYVGLAASADDFANANTGSEYASAAGGSLISAGATAGYAKHGFNISKAGGGMGGGRAGKAAALLLAGPAIYAREVLRSQEAANQKYSGMSSFDLARSKRPDLF